MINSIHEMPMVQFKVFCNCFCCVVQPECYFIVELQVMAFGMTMMTLKKFRALQIKVLMGLR